MNAHAGAESPGSKRADNLSNPGHNPIPVASRASSFVRSVAAAFAHASSSASQ
jgi:hypothetical protein